MKKRIQLFWSFLLLGTIHLNAQCWESVSCGDQFVGAIQQDGSLFMWGSNFSGQLGNGTNVHQFSSYTQVAGNDWSSISISKSKDNNTQSGGEHSLAIQANGTLWTWGNNNEGQLGNGTIVSSNVPIQIGTDSDWKMVVAGSLHSLALKNNGTLWAWGNNAYGQIGNGTLVNVSTPTQIGIGTIWHNISAFESHNLATKTDGTLWSWGKNNYYQLGQGSNQNQSAPAQIGSNTNWIFSAAGYQYSFAIRQDSSLWAWGNNSAGQLGNGNTGSFNPNPIQIGASAKWTDVSPGREHTIALQKDSTLWGWGFNYFGQLGQGNNSFQIPSPVQISTDSNYRLIENGHFYSMSLNSDSTLWAWGQNFANVLATNDNSDRNTLTAVACPTATNFYTTLNETACNNYTSPSGNHIWTSTGIYMDTIPIAGGGDSLILVNLTISISNTGIDIQSACDAFIWMDGNTYTSTNNSATHTLTNVAGCDSLVTLNLTINTVNPSVTQAGVVLLANELGANYQWLECPGMSVINGAINRSYTATANGDYAVIVSNLVCSDTSVCYSVASIGIIENAFGNEITLYPNPTDGFISIDLGNLNKAIHLTIRDLNGRIILSRTYTGQSLLELTLDEPAGVYLLTLESGAEIHTTPFVKR